jgi:hypothetical protein
LRAPRLEKSKTLPLCGRATTTTSIPPPAVAPHSTRHGGFAQGRVCTSCHHHHRHPDNIAESLRVASECWCKSSAGRIITAGKPALTDVQVTGTVPEKELLALVTAAEADSEHLIASAVVAGARDRGINVPAATDFGSITGMGVPGSGRRSHRARRHRDLVRRKWHRHR